MIEFVEVSSNGTSVLLKPRHKDYEQVLMALDASETFKQSKIFARKKEGGDIELYARDLPLSPEVLTNILVQAELIVPSDAALVEKHLEAKLKIHDHRHI